MPVPYPTPELPPGTFQAFPRHLSHKEELKNVEYLELLNVAKELLAGLLAHPTAVHAALKAEGQDDSRDAPDLLTSAAVGYARRLIKQCGDAVKQEGV